MAKFRRFKLNASGIGELPLSMGFPPPHIGTAIDANTTTPPISEIKSHPLPASEAKPNASPPYEVKTSAGPVTEATVFLKPLVNPEQDADELRKALSTFGELAHFRVCTFSLVPSSMPTRSQTACSHTTSEGAS